MDYTLPEFVKEQRIELAVVCKPLDNSTDKWGFPPAQVLQEIFDHVRDRDEVEILDVCLWSRVEKATGIASIMLSTINLALFIETRHRIRTYTAYPGYKLETYQKSKFMDRYGLSMYVPRDNANLSPSRLLRALFYKNKQLYTTKIKLLTRTTFTSDPPNHNPDARSRVGDRILLFDSAELAEKLKPYPETHKFFLSKNFSITFKGGNRAGSDLFTEEARNSMMLGAAGDIGGSGNTQA